MAKHRCTSHTPHHYRAVVIITRIQDEKEETNGAQD